MAQSYVEALTSGVTDWRWNSASAVGTPVTLSYSFMTTPPVYYDGTESGQTIQGFATFTTDMKAAARAVLAQYAEIANITFTDLGNGEGGTLLFGRNTQGGSAGYAYFPSSFWAVGGDVWINNTPAVLDVSPGSYGYETLVHELGHALGLKHPFQTIDDGSVVTLDLAHDSDQYTVMSYTHQSNELFLDVVDTGGGTYDFDYFSLHPAGPQLYDIAAIQYLYGANYATRAGDTTYTFDPAKPFFQCIWDGGGKDTISVSNFSRGCEIDLNAGAFSDIKILPDTLPPGFFGGSTPTYDGRNNLSIAFGVTIENATGGTGADTLTGNNAANVLRGNAGADRLLGGGGSDQLYGGPGVDQLTGGGGADKFYFNSPLTAVVDTVKDFAHAEGDKIVLDDAIFPAVGPALAANEFRSAANISTAGGATTLTQRILYDSDSGNLYYDADGSGHAASPVLVAILTAHPPLVVGDFQVI